jgi:hypothetical protein
MDVKSLHEPASYKCQECRTSIDMSSSALLFAFAYS